MSDLVLGISSSRARIISDLVLFSSRLVSLCVVRERVEALSVCRRRLTSLVAVMPDFSVRLSACWLSTTGGWLANRKRVPRSVVNSSFL